MSVFVDTSAWFALLSPEDKFSTDAVRVLRRLMQGNQALHTSQIVFSETCALLRSRLGKEASLSLEDVIYRNPSVRIHVLAGELFQEAWRRYMTSPAGASFVDQSSFVLMENLGLKKAFSFDADFATAGFELEKA